MRKYIDIVNEENWKTWEEGGPEEMVIGGQIIQVSISKKKAEMDVGPFYSSFDLNGKTAQELKADAVRKAYELMKDSLDEFRIKAGELGIDLKV